MDLILPAFTALVEMMLILLLGFFLGKYNKMDENFCKKLSFILLMVINPATVFKSYQMAFDPQKLQNLLFVLAFSALSYLVQIIGAVIFVRKKGNIQAGVERFAVIFSNCGYMGIPLISKMYGDIGVFYLSAYITMYNIMVWTVGVFLMKDSADMKEFLKNMLNPSLIAVAIGLVFYVSNILLPEVIMEPVSLIAGMNTPVAMLIAGATLSHSNLLAALKKPRLYYLTVLKLFIVPAMVVFSLVFFRVEPMLLMIPIIVSACPSGANTPIFALRYDKDAVYASELLSVTTILSVVTIPVIVFLSNLFL